jgi:flagellar biosynthesis protein FliQ
VAVDVIKAAGPNAVQPAPAPAPTGGASLDVEGAVRTLVGPEHRAEVDRAVRAIEPVRGFLTKHASPRDRDTFKETSTKLGRATSGDELWVLSPAFLATELREAFAIAVLIFVPFLVIDLVVGLGLAALGLSRRPRNRRARSASLFVAVDGWRLLLDSCPRPRVTSALAALVREGLLLALLLAAPLLVAALVAGILTGLLTAFTQIQDPAVSLVPRVAAVGIAIVLFAPSIASQLAAFASRLWPLVTAVGTGPG